MIAENPFANVLRGSFRQWCQENPSHKSNFKKLTPDVIKLIDTCLGELKSYGPGPAYTWYVRNHMRFKVRNDELRIGMDLIQVFLGDYAHGRLDRRTNKNEIKNEGKITDRSEGKNDACGYRSTLNQKNNLTDIADELGFKTVSDLVRSIIEGWIINYKKSNGAKDGL